MALDSRPKQHTPHRRQSPTTMPDAAPPPYENIVAFDTRPAEKADAYSALWSYCNTFCPTPLAIVAGKVSSYMRCNEEPNPDLKKTTSLMVDSQMIQQTIALLQVIADMQAKENGVLQQQSAILDLYLLALERFFSALSLDTNLKAKRKLEHTLAQLKKRHTLTIQLLPSQRSASSCDSTPDSGRLASCSDAASRLAVAVAIAVKRSPIPDIVAWCFSLLFTVLNAVDEIFHIKKKAWLLATQGMCAVLELNERFQIHQLALGLVYTTTTIFMKAAIAYAEASGPQTAS